MGKPLSCVLELVHRVMRTARFKRAVTACHLFEIVAKI
jgi:hypothetical protein